VRQRQSLKVDRKSGDATVTTETLDDDAGFAQRIRDLKESVPDIGPVEARFLATLCDGCGARAALDFENPRLPDGWAATGAGDFCPACQAMNLSARYPRYGYPAIPSCGVRIYIAWRAGGRIAARGVA